MKETKNLIISSDPDLIWEARHVSLPNKKKSKKKVIALLSRLTWRPIGFPNPLSGCAN